MHGVGFEVADFKDDAAKSAMNHWPKIDLWHLTKMEGGIEELCDIFSCTQVARVIVVISYLNGCAFIRKYCSGHESNGIKKLKRNHPRVQPNDHRSPISIRGRRLR